MPKAVAQRQLTIGFKILTSIPNLLGDKADCSFMPLINHVFHPYSLSEIICVKNHKVSCGIVKIINLLTAYMLAPGLRP